jgi:hypothetical protein
MIPRAFHVSAHARKLFIIIASPFVLVMTVSQSFVSLSASICIRGVFFLLYPCPLHPIRHLFVLLFLLLTGHDSVPNLSVPVCPFLQDLLSFVSFTHYSSVRCLIRLNQDFVFVGALFICVCHSTRHRLFFLRGEVSYGIPSVHMSHSNTAAITL